MKRKQILALLLMLSLTQVAPIMGHEVLAKETNESTSGVSSTFANSIKKHMQDVKQNENDIVGVISFNIGNINAEKVVYNLDIKHNIMLRAGLHCSPNAHELIGTKDVGTVRIGIGYFNEFNDIDKLVYALNDIQNS